MHSELLTGLLLVILVAVFAAEKSEPERPASPPVADGKTPSNPHPGQATPHHSGHHQGGHPAAHGNRRLHRKNPHGHKREQPGGKSHQGAAALKEEIARIQNSDLSEEEKAARQQALRMHVKEGQMLQHMPPEVRARREELQTTLEGIYQNEDLTEEEKNQRIEEERAKFKADIAAMRESLTSEQFEQMREEKKKTIEGHTAAAMAAKRVGLPKMAREYQRRAKEAAKGVPQKRRRRSSLSQPNFF